MTEDKKSAAVASDPSAEEPAGAPALKSDEQLVEIERSYHLPDPGSPDYWYC